MEQASCFLHGEFDAALLRCPECAAKRAAHLTPDQKAEIEREIDQTQAKLVWLRDKRAGFVSSLAKIEDSIGAEERAIARDLLLLGNDTA